MIQSFAGPGTEDIFHGRDSKAARRCCPRAITTVGARKLEQIDSAGAIIDLAVPPGNRLEPLKGRRRGQHSIRINDQYRICFTWTDEGAHDVEIVDHHR